MRRWGVEKSSQIPGLNDWGEMKSFPETRKWGLGGDAQVQGEVHESRARPCTPAIAGRTAGGAQGGLSYRRNKSPHLHLTFQPTGLLCIFPITGNSTEALLCDQLILLLFQNFA